MTQELTAEEQAQMVGMIPSTENKSCIVGKCDGCGRIVNDLLPVDDYGLLCAFCDADVDDDNGN